MVTKVWKHIGNNPIEYGKFEVGKTSWVRLLQIQKIRNNYYAVNIYSEKDLINFKTYKTKIDAMKRATSYMRTH